MASGVEMLGQMSETDALAGPVQGGNMVVKPNEVPVGGAAMLAKALRGQSNKGVGGIYELPSQEQPTPQFMQMAQQGVKDDMTRMTRMIEAEAPPGEMLAYINPEEAGILQMLGGSGDIQPTTGIPSFRPPGYDSSEDDNPNFSGYSKSIPDRNRGQTSSNNNNNTGSTNQRYEDYYSSFDPSTAGSAGVSGSSRTTQESDEEKKQRRDAEQSYFGGNENYGGRKQTSTGQTTLTTDDAEELRKKGQEDQIDKSNKSTAKVKQLEKQIKKLKKEGKSTTALEKQLGKEQTALSKIMDQIKYQQKQILQSDQTGAGEKLSAAGDKIKKKLKEFGIIGNEIKDIESLPKETQEEMMRLLNNFERLNVSPKEAYNWQSTMGKSMSDGEYREDDKDNPLYNEDGSKVQTLQGVKKALRALDTGGGASVLESLRKYRPELYYDKFRVRQTAGDLKDFGRNETVDTSGMDRKSQEYQKAKRYNNAIFDAREKGRDGQMGGMDNNQNNRPQFMQQTQEGVIDMPGGIVDEESQTMEYTSPRTGGTETSVPLQRRFSTDPTQDVARYRTAPRSESDIYKYATQGTTGEGIGLEPFSEYQRRRRKALGQDELGLFN